MKWDWLDVKYWLDDNRTKLLAIIGGLVALFIIITVTLTLKTVEAPTKIISEAESEVVKDVYSPEMAESLGIDVKVNAPDNVEQLEDGFYIVGPYTSQYDSLGVFLGFYETYEDRYAMTGLEDESPIIYKRFRHVVPVEGTKIDDLKEVMDNN